MKAIIYAAGRGTRLQSDTPKILLEFGGRTLLEWHALRLREADVREVVLVTGYRREQIAELLPGICARHGVAVHAAPATCSPTPWRARRDPSGRSRVRSGASSNSISPPSFAASTSAGLIASSDSDSG